MPRQFPKVGDIFSVPLDDGSTTIGQVLETRPIVMNSMTCVFYDAKSDDPESAAAQAPNGYRAISCQFVTRDQFNKGKWRRIRNEEPSHPKKDFPHRDTEESSWVGAKVIESGDHQQVPKCFLRSSRLGRNQSSRLLLQTVVIWRVPPNMSGWIWP